MNLDWLRTAGLFLVATATFLAAIEGAEALIGRWLS